MLRLLLKKTIQVVPVLLLVTFFVTALISLIPGNPAVAVLGTSLSKSAIHAFDVRYGLDHPFFQRYWNWLFAAVHGNFGRSYQTYTPVKHLIIQRLPVTTELAIITLAVALILAIPLSVLSAVGAGGRFDRIVTAITSSLIATPSFVAAVIVVYVLAVRARLFPSSGWVPLNQNVGENLHDIILPVFTLIMTITPHFVRVLRADVVSVLREDFVLTARSRGLPEWYILFRHVLRPALPSLFTVAGLVFGYLFGGSIIVETFFGLPGVGLLSSQAVLQQDLPIVQGVVVWVAAAYLAVNVLVDMSHAIIDPRIRAR